MNGEHVGSPRIESVIAIVGLLDCAVQRRFVEGLPKNIRTLLYVELNWKIRSKYTASFVWRLVETEFVARLKSPLSCFNYL